MRKENKDKWALFFAGLFTCLLLVFTQVHPANAAGVKGYASDSAITTEVKGKFLVEKGLDSMDIKVKTDNGIVTLRGQVFRRSQSSLAEKIARETKGVRGVNNKISVMPE